jgi:undecaprenyl-diphosphatase
MIELIDQLDKSILLWFNGVHNDFWDHLMLFASAKLTWLPFYLFLLYLIIKEYRFQTFLILAFVVLAVTLSDQTSVHLFKNVFQRLRPCHQEELIQNLWLPAGCGGQYGFVSSHAANSFSVMMFLSLLLKKRWLTIVLIVWASFVSISRVYLAAHFPSDILGGALLGLLTGLVTYLLFRLVYERVYKKPSHINT